MIIRWTRRATGNLDDIKQAIAADNPSAADRMADRIAASLLRLADFPESRRPGRVFGTRELVVPGTPYLVIYRVRSTVEVLRVIYGARKWPLRPSEQM